VWPPKPGSQQVIQSGPPRREKQPKPPGGKTLFAGNLSFNIDDDTMVDFFKDCGTLVGLRWLTHKDSGEFKVLRLSFVFLFIILLKFKILKIKFLYVLPVFLYLLKGIFI